MQSSGNSGFCIIVFVTNHNIIAFSGFKFYNNTIMRKRFAIIWLVIFVILMERILSLTSVFKKLELITFDIRSKIATDIGPFNNQFKHADKKIVLVAIDDYSRKEIANHAELGIGSFPWDRDIWAGIVDFIEKGEPKVVLFDIIFNGLNENSWNDRRFAQSLRQYDNVVLATSLNDPKYLVDNLSDKSAVQNSDYPPTAMSLDVKVEDKKLDDKLTYYSHAPVHYLYTRHNMTGVVNKVVGSDSVIRNVQPLFKLIKDDEVYYLPSLSFAGFVKYMGDDSQMVVKDGQIHYKGRVIPIDKNGETTISWHGRGKNYTYIPISKILLSEDNDEYISPEFFKDKIVVIGRTEAGTDIHPSAVNPSYAGPESNAAAIDNFINDSVPNAKGVRKFISEMSVVNAFFLTILACCFIVFIGVVSKNALLTFVNCAGFMALYVLFCVWAFAAPQIRIWVPIAIPMFYLVMTAAVMFAYRFQKELAKRATVMNMFGKFVSPKVLTTLLKNQENLTLDSTKKRITVLFCDVKNFTTLSEKCNPEQLVSNLNELFDVIVDTVFENNGTVDKFIGDCIMAYWGDPIAHEDDAYMAVKTALEIKKRVADLAVENAKEGKIIFDVKIGINTGEALLGLAGSQKIMSYTAMGDAVNVASRLESNCSKLDRDVLISKSTYDDAKDKIVVLQAGSIKAKGRDEQIEAFEPIGLAETFQQEQVVTN